MVCCARNRIDRDDNCPKAHEDGPSYYPVVATLTLGSHAVFHYYRYKPDNATLDSAEGPNTSNGNGKAVDTTPVMSVLLEPRSLVITMSDLYTSHLHGIDDIVEDVFPTAPLETESNSFRISLYKFDMRF